LASRSSKADPPFLTTGMYLEAEAVKRMFTILVADRNPHIRDFLKRELANDGFKVHLAKSAAEVLDWAFGPERLDLLILDPDLPDLKDEQLYEKLDSRIPALPVVIHGFLPVDDQWSEILDTLGFVEKMGNSIEPLKTLIYNLLPNDGPSPEAPSAAEQRSGP